MVDHLRPVPLNELFSITTARQKHPTGFIADLGVIFGLLASGKIRPRVAARIALDAVADAHARIERGGLEGRSGSPMEVGS